MISFVHGRDILHKKIKRETLHVGIWRPTTIYIPVDTFIGIGEDELYFIKHSSNEETVEDRNKTTEIIQKCIATDDPKTCIFDTITDQEKNLSAEITRNVMERVTDLSKYYPFVYENCENPTHVEEGQICYQASNVMAANCTVTNGIEYCENYSKFIGLCDDIFMEVAYRVVLAFDELCLTSEEYDF